MTDINHLLFLQETIKTECKSIIDEQCQNPGDYADKQALLNNLFVQHMDLNVKVIGLLATDKPALSDAALNYEVAPSDTAECV